MSSQEVNEAVGTAPDLDRQIAALETALRTPTERDTKTAQLADLKKQKAERDRAALRGEADARITAIKRAYGGELDGLDQDRRKIAAAAAEYARLWAMMNERYVKLGRWRGEHDAINDGFALGAAPLPPLPNLASAKDLGAAAETVARVGVPDTVRIFNVNELAGTDGHALLVRAGKLKS